MGFINSLIQKKKKPVRPTPLMVSQRPMVVRLPSRRLPALLLLLLLLPLREVLEGSLLLVGGEVLLALRSRRCQTKPEGVLSMVEHRKENE